MLYRILRKCLGLLLLTGVFLNVNIEAALYFVTEENAVNSDNFILDFDDTATDFIDLEFGASLGSKIRYDVLNSKFIINRNLDLSGHELTNTRIENRTTAPTCNASTSGQIYFNTIEKLTYTCDGVGTWNPLENVLNATVEFPVVQARRTTSYTLTTAYEDVTLDTTDLENDTTTLDHDDTNRDRIDIGVTAMYQIIYGYTAGGSATSTHEARARVRANDTRVLPGSQSVNTNYNGEFSTTSASFLTNLSAGDFISLQLQRDATIDTTQDEIYFSITKLEGIKGRAGTNGADGDISWKGTWVSQNYVLHDTVEYQGSAYTCILNTLSSEVPTNTTYWNLVAAKGDVGPQGPAGSSGNGTDAETFTLDTNDTGGNLGLVFGTTLAKSLFWDSSNLRFNLNDTLRTSGNLEQDGNVLALDADNTGTGANIDIVANQGSDNDGTLRYNAANHDWEFSNDGGAFTPFFVPQVFDGYDNTGLTALSQTQSVLNIDTARVLDGAYTLSGDVVTFNRDGLYRLTGRLTAESLNTSGAQRSNIEMRFQSDKGGGFADVPGAACEDYMREQNAGISTASCSVTWLGSFSTNDRVQLTHRMSSSTTGRTLPGGSGLTIEFIR